jgi:hypothetical protein
LQLLFFAEALGDALFQIGTTAFGVKNLMGQTRIKR